MENFAGIGKIERQTEEIDFYGDTIEVAIYLPENISDDIKTIVVPGWGETDTTLRSFANAYCNESNRIVETFNHPRKDNWIPSESDNSGLQNIDHQLRKASVLLSVIEEEESKVDIIAHSEGAINACIAAINEPEKFRSMVLIAPGGMVGERTLLQHKRLFNRSVGSSIMSVFTNKKLVIPVSRSLLDMADYFIKNPKRAVSEAQQISATQIIDVLGRIKGFGIRVAVVCGVDDKLFPMDSIQSQFKHGDSRLDGFYSTKGAHDHIFTHPEEYAIVASHAISSLSRL